MVHLTRLYNPDKAKALLKQARAVGTPLKIVCSANVAYSRECGQIVQEQWNSVYLGRCLRRNHCSGAPPHGSRVG